MHIPHLLVYIGCGVVLDVLKSQEVVSCDEAARDAHGIGHIHQDVVPVEGLGSSSQTGEEHGDHSRGLVKESGQGGDSCLVKLLPCV